MSKVHPTSALAAAIMDVVIARYRVPGEAVASINVLDATHALCVALAMLVDADAENLTPKDIREASLAAGKQVHAQAKLFREEFERTGVRSWLILSGAVH